MKVYRVKDVAGYGTARQKYASLAAPSDRIIARESNEFQGKPYSKKWRPYTVPVDEVCDKAIVCVWKIRAIAHSKIRRLDSRLIEVDSFIAYLWS